MNTTLLGINLLFLITTWISIVLIIFILHRNRMETPGVKYFSLLLITVLVYNLAYLGELNSKTLERAYTFLMLEYLAIPFQPYFWLMMTLDFCDISEKMRKPLRSFALIHPIFVLIAFFSNPATHLYYRSVRFEDVGPFFSILTEKGPFYFTMTTLVALFGVFCMTLYYRGYRNAATKHKRKYLIMMISTAMPWLAVFLNTANIFKIDCAALFSTVSMVIVAYGVFFLHLFYVMPIAMELAFHKSVEGMALSDLKGYILEYNEAFTLVYPDISNLPKWERLETFLSQHPELQEIADGKEFAQFHKVRDGQTLYYSAHVVPLLAQNGKKLGQLLSVFDITSHILYQNELKAKAEAAEKKASLSEISFLQAQIKPHFLYNTLSVISSMISRNPTEARNLILNLSDYFRSSCFFDTLDAMTPLDEELETVSAYIRIEKARFGDRLNFRIQCEEIPAVNIPRLTLQPLIENAINHGIMKKPAGGHVILSIIPEQRKVRFSVIDDGVGLPELIADSLLFGGQGSGRSIGLTNIQKRLTKYYGEGLTIESQEGKGTRISFSVPC